MRSLSILFYIGVCLVCQLPFLYAGNSPSSSVSSSSSSSSSPSSSPSALLLPQLTREQQTAFLAYLPDSPHRDLLLAIGYNHFDTAVSLIEGLSIEALKGIGEEFIDAQSCSLLHVALWLKRWNILEKLLSHMVFLQLGPPLTPAFFWFHLMNKVSQFNEWSPGDFAEFSRALASSLVTAEDISYLSTPHANILHIAAVCLPFKELIVALLTPTFLQNPLSRLLLNAVDSHGRCPLVAALYYNNLDAFALFLPYIRWMEYGAWNTQVGPRPCLEESLNHTNPWHVVAASYTHLQINSNNSLELSLHEDAFRHLFTFLSQWGFDINGLNEEAKYPLYIAIERGIFFLVDEILNFGASCDQLGPTLIFPIDRAYQLFLSDSSIERQHICNRLSNHAAPSSNSEEDDSSEPPVAPSLIPTQLNLYDSQESPTASSFTPTPLNSADNSPSVSSFSPHSSDTPDSFYDTGHATSSDSDSSLPAEKLNTDLPPPTVRRSSPALEEQVGPSSSSAASSSSAVPSSSASIRVPLWYSQLPLWLAAPPLYLPPVVYSSLVSNVSQIVFDTPPSGNTTVEVPLHPIPPQAVSAPSSSLSLLPSFSSTPASSPPKKFSL